MKRKIEPGEPKAKTMGCRCSGEKSEHGGWWITAGCPLHCNPKSPHHIPLKFEFV